MTWCNYRVGVDSEEDSGGRIVDLRGPSPSTRPDIATVPGRDHKPPKPADDPPPGRDPDGRSARRERNRRVVLDCVLKCFGDGEFEPSFKAVAERSGLSVRTLYRYFDAPSDMIQQAVVYSRVIARSMVRLDDLGQGTLESRIDRLARSRSNLFETMAPILRACDRKLDPEDLPYESYQRSRVALREQTTELFDREIARLGERGSVTRTALVAAFSFTTYDSIRQEQGRSVEEAIAAMVLVARCLLDVEHVSPGHTPQPASTAHSAAAAASPTTMGSPSAGETPATAIAFPHSSPS